MYLVNTRPDICHAVNTFSQFMVEPKRAHWAATKHVLRYIQGTVEHGLLYTQGDDIRLSGFTDANWAGSSVDRKSTTRYFFNIGSGMTSCCSRKQKYMAPSLTKSEYMAATTASCEAIWLRKLLVNLFKRRMEATRILCDNQSCIKLSKNPVFHDRSKHIEIRCHFVRHYAQQEAVQLSAAVSSGSAMASMMQRIQRELQYRCSSDSCNVMGNSTGCSNAIDEGQSTNLMDQCGASIGKHR
eukprot:PITA_23864